jgi:hypothetical protein
VNYGGHATTALASEVLREQRELDGRDLGVKMAVG